MASISEEAFLKRKKERLAAKGKQLAFEATNVTKEQSNPNPSKKGKIIGIIAVAILLIGGGITAALSQNNNQISEIMAQVIEKEKEIANNYPDCSKSAALKDGTNTNLYHITDNHYEQQSNSVGDFENYLKELASLEQLCASEKAQKEAEAKAEAERQKLENEKQAAEAKAAQAQAQAAEAKAAQAQAEAKAQAAQAQAAEEQRLRETAEMQAKLAETNTIENTANRLSPVKAITFSGKKYVSWLIMYDNTLKTHCHVITNSKYPPMQTNRWCIPFSGNESDLTDTFAATVAMDYADRKICKIGVSKAPSNGQSHDDYCTQMFNALQEQAQRENWASMANICKSATDPKIKEYCGYLF